MSWQMEVAARTLWQEVRGEPPQGQDAVAHVIKNRLWSGRWGHTLASVCLWRGQFSGWYRPTDPNFAAACALPDNDPTLEKMRDVMQRALDSATNPTNGATHYVNAARANPAWDDDAIFCGQFGHHKFYKGVK